MKKKFTIVFLLYTFILSADEGMWLPHLLEAMIYSKMKNCGLKIPADVIYSVNKASMKDAVMLFGRGCTAEAISPNGLIITNHHCGYGPIVNVSSPEKNYLKNGFWAKSLKEEIPCPNLSVTFIRKIEDVTEKIIGNIKEGTSDLQRDSVVQSRIKNLEQESSASSGCSCIIRSFYYGNEFIMFYTETFPDVRLVGTPEEIIGKFGGETDNWMWPRHNPDFSVFRIYAGKDNKPAPYSPENVPYKPGWFFPISIKPLKENDFTMVYGFPGQTQQYLPSAAVDLIVNFSNPLKIHLREVRLKIYEKYMSKNDTLKLMYADRYAGVANYYKKWKGENTGILRTHALDSIRKEEAELLESLRNQPEVQNKIKILFEKYASLYEEMKPLIRQTDIYQECISGVDIFRFALKFSDLLNELIKKNNGLKNKYTELKHEILSAVPFKNLYTESDKELFAAMMKEYETYIGPEWRPVFIDSVLKVYKGDYASMAGYFYSRSMLCHADGVKEIINQMEKSTEILQNDPLFRWANSFYQHYGKNVFPLVQQFEKKIIAMHREYMRYQKEYLKNKIFYPDANGTLRVSYGKIKRMKPRDGVEYQWYTTVYGMLEKSRSGNSDYALTPRIEEMISRNRFGNYARNAREFRISFIASNHTTGGNSGSPVLNAYGHLIGINYDRCWESTMSDLYYHVDLCRNISLDMRFMLWYMDMYAQAGHLLKEMKIIR